MGQLDTVCMQGLAGEEDFIVVRSGLHAVGRHATPEFTAADLSVAGVELVTEYGAANVSQMHANLMRTAGLWQDLESCESGESLEDIVKGGSLATGGVAGADGHFFALVRMNANRLRGQVAITVRHANGDGEILLFRCAGFELRGEGEVHRVGFSDDHDAARVAIKAMHNSRPRWPTNAAQLPKVIRERAGQCSRPVATSGMDDHSRWLIDGDDVLVFVEDI